jgi:hypothetical protein
MMTYFKVFVFLLFPPAALLLTLLVLPFPLPVTKLIIRWCDKLLFWRPHPHIPLSLFWCVLALSFLTFAETFSDMGQAWTEYHESKKAGRSDRTLIRLMAEERNAWISGFAFVLWVLLHRFRNLLKQNHRLIDEKYGKQKPLSEVQRPVSTPVAVTQPVAGGAPASVVAQPVKPEGEKKKD